MPDPAAPLIKTRAALDVAKEWGTLTEQLEGLRAKEQDIQDAQTRTLTRMDTVEKDLLELISPDDPIKAFPVKDGWIVLVQWNQGVRLVKAEGK